ncbi:MAG: glycosyltransferase family 9 protein [Armatimonadota bacterium]|nr:glycosyltransferase family 9 protein [Armatimonadota bacterium]MDW8024958.1 glycosyltransferase family 9 protein [Armatimonadota bacterium]
MGISPRKTVGAIYNRKLNFWIRTYAMQKAYEGVSVMDEGYPRIVAFTLNHIGDVLFTEPAITALRAGYPKARLIVITSPVARAVLEQHPDIDELWVRERTLKGWFKLVIKVTQVRPDITVCFSPSSFGMTIAAWVSGAPKRFGFSYRPYLSHFFTCAVEFQYNRHIVYDNLELATAAGGKISRDMPRIFLSDHELENGRHWLDRQGLLGKPILGCHPFASTIKRQWELENWAELLNLAANKFGASVIVFGGIRDKNDGEKLANIVGGLNVAGHLSLRQFFSVVSHCQVFIGLDSGPTHAAAALGTPTVALYGPETRGPVRASPLGKNVEVIYGETGSWAGVTLERVMDGLERVWQNSKRTAH